MGRTLKEDLYTITEYLVRYAPAKPSVAIPRLLNIEVIRNNYTKSTLYNVFNGVRHTLKTGKKHKYIPTQMFNIIMNNFYKNETTKTEEPKQAIGTIKSAKEIVSELKLSLQILEEAIEKDLKALDIQEEMIKEKRNEIRAARDFLLTETKNEITNWTIQMYKEQWLA